MKGKRDNSIARIKGDSYTADSLDSTNTAELTYTRSSQSTVHSERGTQQGDSGTFIAANHEGIRADSDAASTLSLSTTIAILGGVSCTSFATFVALLIPFPALLALLLFIISCSSMLFIVLEYWIRRLAEDIQTQGIGHYLPASIYDQLTNATLHEWLQDSSFTLEYRHLLLYFVPGISPDQLEHYVNSLTPRHRNRLRQRGLGHMFGEGFMRLLMGNERYRFHSLENHSRPTELLLPPSLPPELMHDAESDLDSISQHSLIVQRDLSATSQPRDVSRAISSSVAHQDLNNEIDCFDQENQVITDAFQTLVNNVISVSVESATSGFVYVVERLTPYAISSGIGVTTLAAGVGAFIQWSQHRPSTQRLIQSPWLPSNQSLWMTAFLGGFSAGGTFLFRWGVRRLVSRSTGTILDAQKPN